MTEEFYYKKVGKKFVKIGTYSEDWDRTMPFGVHLMYSYENGTTYTYQVDPAIAPYAAAAMMITDSISTELVLASKFSAKEEPYAPEQIAARDNLQKVMGDKMFSMTSPSLYEIVNKVSMTIADRAKELIGNNPAVAQAYEEFLTLVKLSK